MNSKWISSKYTKWIKEKSEYPDVIIHTKDQEVKYLGKFRKLSKFFTSLKEAAVWADTERIKNNLEPRNILKKK